jgi:hypothetical protein
MRKRLREDPTLVYFAGLYGGLLVAGPAVHAFILFLAR